MAITWKMQLFWGSFSWTSSAYTGTKKKMTAKLVVEANEKTKILEAFTLILCEICQGVVTEEALLTAKPFNLTYSWREVINSISRKTTTYQITMLLVGGLTKKLF